MSTTTDFLQKCINIPVGNKFHFFIESSIKSLASVDFASEKKDICKFLRQANADGNLNNIGLALVKCIDYCNEKKESVPGSDSDADLIAFSTLLNQLYATIDEVSKQPDEEDSQQDLSDLTGIQTALKSYGEKIAEFQTKLQSVDNTIEKQNDAIDSKVFQLLVNTISVLGIFVAIAIVGFGGITITNNVDFSEDLVRGVFSCLLTSTVVYNILFMLVYFLYSILRDFYSKAQSAEGKSTTKGHSLFKLFAWIDVVLIGVTIIFFFLAYFNL